MIVSTLNAVVCFVGNSALSNTIPFPFGEHVIQVVTILLAFADVALLVFVLLPLSALAENTSLRCIFCLNSVVFAAYLFYDLLSSQLLANWVNLGVGTCMLLFCAFFIWGGENQ